MIGRLTHGCPPSLPRALALALSLVWQGELKGSTGKLIGIDGRDGIVKVTPTPKPFTKCLKPEASSPKPGVCVYGPICIDVERERERGRETFTSQFCVCCYTMYCRVTADRVPSPAPQMDLNMDIKIQDMPSLAVYVPAE